MNTPPLSWEQGCELAKLIEEYVEKVADRFQNKNKKEDKYLYEHQMAAKDACHDFVTSLCKPKKPIEEKIILYGCEKMKKKDRAFLISRLERFCDFCNAESIWYGKGVDLNVMRITKHVRPSGDPHLMPYHMAPNVNVYLPKDDEKNNNFFVFDG